METEELIEFDEKLGIDFVDEMFNTCLVTNDKHILDIVISNIKPIYLPEEEQRDFFKELKIQFKVEQKMPTFGSMQLAFHKNRSKLIYLEKLRESNTLTENTLISSLEGFVRTSMFVQLYDEVGEMYNKGEKKKAYTKFITDSKKLSEFGFASKKFGRVFGDFHKRNINRIVDSNNSEKNVHIPTGIVPLDKSLHGGPQIGDLVCFLGDSKAGKSFALSHCGLTAAKLGFPVFHVQAEDTEEKLNNRYDSAWMGIPYYDVLDCEIPQNRFNAYKKIIQAIGKGEIYIYAPGKFGNITVTQIRQYVLDLRKQGIDIKVLIVDYWDLIDPDEQQYKPSEERFRQSSTGKALKNLALELGLVVITATQASSIETELLNDENFVITREHLAEDKGKVRPVNTLITINCSKEEKKRKECRLFVEAARDNEGGQVLKIKRNLAQSRFYDHKATLKMYDDEMQEED